MPIEDVSYLKKHSVENAQIIKVDSNLRNKQTFPTASEFVVEFDEPLNYVFGLDVIDVSMPSSMYNIENINNSFKFHKIWLNNTFTGNQVDENDFYKYYLLEVSTNPVLAKYVFSKRNNKIIIADATQLDKIDLDYVESVDEHNVLAIRYELDGKQIKRVFNINTNDLYTYFKFDDEWYVLTNETDVNTLLTELKAGDQNKKEIDVSNKDFNFYSFLKRQTLSIPIINPEKKTSITIYEFEHTNVYNDQNPTKIVYYRFKFLTDLEYHTNLAKNKTKLNEWCPVIMFNGYFELEPGNLDIFDFQNEMIKSIQSSYELFIQNKVNSFPFEDATQAMTVEKVNERGDLIRTGQIKFRVNDPNIHFMIDLKQSSLYKTIGFSSMASINKKERYKIVTPERIRNDHTFVASVHDINDSNVIIPPGVIDLLGIRYVLLRCPEIESLIGSQPGQLSPGIGVFKLALNQETVQQRLDFVHFVRKPFHPIEKLKKLTFRFELSSGELYDFKGVDVFMILQINSYAPTTGDDFNYTHSQLNPNYDPNFIRYNINQQKKIIQQKKLEESDDEDESSTDGNSIREIVRLQEQYDNSTESNSDCDSNENESSDSQNECPFINNYRKMDLI